MTAAAAAADDDDDDDGDDDDDDTVTQSVTRLVRRVKTSKSHAQVELGHLLISEMLLCITVVGIIDSKLAKYQC